MELNEPFCRKLLDLVDLLKAIARDKITFQMVLDERGPGWHESYHRLRSDPEVQKRITQQLADILELRRQMLQAVTALRRASRLQISNAHRFWVGEVAARRQATATRVAAVFMVAESRQSEIAFALRRVRPQ